MYICFIIWDFCQLGRTPWDTRHQWRTQNIHLCEKVKPFFNRSGIIVIWSEVVFPGWTLTLCLNRNGLKDESLHMETRSHSEETNVIAHEVWISSFTAPASKSWIAGSGQDVEGGHTGRVCWWDKGRYVWNSLLHCTCLNLYSWGENLTILIVVASNFLIYSG